MPSSPRRRPSSRATSASSSPWGPAPASSVRSGAREPASGSEPASDARWLRLCRCRVRERRVRVRQAVVCGGAQCDAVRDHRIGAPDPRVGRWMIRGALLVCAHQAPRDLVCARACGASRCVWCGRSAPRMRRHMRARPRPSRREGCSASKCRGARESEARSTAPLHANGPMLWLCAGSYTHAHTECTRTGAGSWQVLTGPSEQRAERAGRSRH
mmetsp:Transcript_40789/g.112169  ORF Transcript_40789/g.112169 Transcript_40789/m.112169 type:complete len:214 (-) Transcript_40789:167-808(-)